jgi:acyl-coenzyme A synthetase/AMP-(fatty) acid ligase
MGVDQPALIYDSPVTGTKRTFTHTELLDQVARFAGVLRGLGVGKGDRVVVDLPMVPEASIAMLACARIGAVHAVVFGGFAPHEPAVRIDDAGVRAPRLVRLATTGKPKGVVRDSGGHAVALRWSMKNVYGINPGDVYWVASDVGWVVGHSCIVYGPLLAGATTVLYEGKPVGTPDAGAFRRMISEDRINALFTAPTAFRAIERPRTWAGSIRERRSGWLHRTAEEGGALVLGVDRRQRSEAPTAEHLKKCDVSSMHTLFLAGEFLAGERLDPDTYSWATETLGILVVDHWWQTETGWAIAANVRGLEPMPIKAGFPVGAGAGAGFPAGAGAGFPVGAGVGAGAGFPAGAGARVRRSGARPRREGAAG